MLQPRKLFLLTLAVIISTSPVLAQTSLAQTGGEEDDIALLMESMSSAAKVGQLFLVTFPGAEVADDALITELIRDYHVGGVMLTSENGNIVNEGDTATQVATLISQLQETTWAATQAVTETLGEESPPPGPFVPLFIAVNHEGNGMPFTGVVEGMTPLPSQMALGATWNPAHAETVGHIAGQELRVLGVNMLLGPSLDVLEYPRPRSAGDLGVRSFGGEPFWVGQMGEKYIRGVHEGAGGQIAVIAKHFPGLGASDRSLDEEVPTVQRTLEKLRQVDLAPFFAVAQADDPLVRPDGFMVTHIRFRGLEGGRFVTTRPASVDSQMLQQLLAQPELAGWRESGGVVVSDGLGLRALRRFYDANETSFNSRRIAQEAFLAGNDILLLSQFALTESWQERADNVKSTITFFRQKYDSEPSFQALVDAAVARILRLKRALYSGSFTLSAVEPDAEQASGQVGLYREMLSAISRDGITLLSPPSPDLIPPPPSTEDNIVIFTDDRQERPCATCAPVPYIDPLILQETIVRLYGPGGTGQISTWRVSSFTFSQLEEYLDAAPLPPQPTPETEGSTPLPPYPVKLALENADWILFGMLNPTAAWPQSGAVRRFLAERADTLRNPRLVVLVYDAPYYLDATEISKLSAYYGVYSRIEPFIETSVRAMFGEFVPVGTPPVSVSGINYDLPVQTSPDPDQTITLHYEIGGPPAEGEPTPEPTAESQPTSTPTEEGQPTPAPRLEVGDELTLRTGVILDQNGHAVPDGTPVNFIFTYPQEGLEHSTLTTTRDGVAETVTTLDRTGQLDISIQADPIPRTKALQIVIQEGEPAIIVPITSTPRPTVPIPTPTPTAEPEPTLATTPQPTPGAENEGESARTAGSGLMDLTMAMVSVLLVGGIGYYAIRFNNGPASQALRLALWCVIGGLALYLVYALGLPGVAWLREQSGVWTAGWITVSGSVIALLITWIFGRRRQPE